MSALLKNLLGNGAKDREAIEEMRSILEGMQQERGRFETLLVGARSAADVLRQLGEPIAKVAGDAQAVTACLLQLERRVQSLGPAVARFETLDERAQGIEQHHREAEARLAGTIEDAQRVRSAYEEIAHKVELALALKDQLESFLEVDRPFQELRGEAEALRGQLDGTVDHLARLREQHDRLVDAHKLAVAKVEALERRRDDLGRDLQDKERRVTGVEQSMRGLDGAQNTVADLKGQLGALKALGDAVARKTAALEAQRELVERALARAEDLDRIMRQVDAGVRQQRENEQALSALQGEVEALRGLHETVVDRSREISNLQREIDEAVRGSRQELAGARDETTKAVERFDFESRGLESVSQRVADLRAALSQCESRFQGLGEMNRAVSELTTQTQAAGSRLAAALGDAERIDAELAKLPAARRELEQASRGACELGAPVRQLEAARPAIAEALRGLEQLGGAHAAVKDALERTQSAREEFTRLWESHEAARPWLGEVEKQLAEVRTQIGEVREALPTLELVQTQAERIRESQSAIEARREFVEDLHRKLAELGALAGRLDERDRQLTARMEAAEQRFVSLATHAEEAERLGNAMAAVTAAVAAAERTTAATGQAVGAAQARCQAVEALAERTQRLKQDLDQRQRGLEEAARDLEQATELRQEAAAAAQKLGELAAQLGTGLATADQRLAQVGILAGEIEGRAAALQAVERRLDEFADRLGKWERVDEEVCRSLEQISVRQATVEALRTDLDRMSTMAEKTVTAVRAIAAERREVEEGRQLVEEVLRRLREVRETAGALEEREHQLGKAEERLARADALLVDVRSSLEALQGEKALVEQAVEKAGSLQFLVKQAEAAVEALREERQMTADVRAAVAIGGDDDEDDEVRAKAA